VNEDDKPNSYHADEQDGEQELQLTGLEVGLISAHEFFTSARGSGFSRGEALYLAACALAGGPRPPVTDHDH
jgi:hypothetical protein